MLPAQVLEGRQGSRGTGAIRSSFVHGALFARGDRVGLPTGAGDADAPRQPHQQCTVAPVGGPPGDDFRNHQHEHLRGCAQAQSDLIIHSR